MSENLIANLKRFFEVKESLSRLEDQIKDLKDDKKSYLETLERLENQIKSDLGAHNMDGVEINHELKITLENAQERKDEE